MSSRSSPSKYSPAHRPPVIRADRRGDLGPRETGARDAPFVRHELQLGLVQLEARERLRVRASGSPSESRRPRRVPPSISAPRSAPWKSRRISRELSPSTFSSEPRCDVHVRVGETDHDLVAQHAHHFLDVARVGRIDDGRAAEAAPGREVVVLHRRLPCVPSRYGRRRSITTGAISRARGLDVAAGRQPEVVPDHVGLRDRQVVDLAARAAATHEHARRRDARRSSRAARPAGR